MLLKLESINKKAAVILLEGKERRKYYVLSMIIGIIEGVSSNCYENPTPIQTSSVCV